ncbi:PDDEXK nuclease domain-containing protein [Candidatus Uabimicrobium sp. HlEnr_7]|uniref:PDDEXK nuclease domain-containing protein n=1 Tax=Candidatus Uabimicrobium helgolandensis TaxID=3095367 RepID=UPI0035581C51
MFFLEFGKDFTFVGRDFFIDLLLFHRELRCLVAIELKIDEFQPEYLRKLNFYLEALDQKIKKIHENPSVGIILCASKDNEVVEYSLNRNISPAMVADYQTKLIDKKVLQEKLHEFFSMSSEEHDDYFPRLKIDGKLIEILEFCCKPKKRKHILERIGAAQSRQKISKKSI